MSALVPSADGCRDTEATTVSPDSHAEAREREPDVEGAVEHRRGSRLLAVDHQGQLQAGREVERGPAHEGDGGHVGAQLEPGRGHPAQPSGHRPSGAWSWRAGPYGEPGAGEDFRLPAAGGAGRASEHRRAPGGGGSGRGSSGGRSVPPGRGRNVAIRWLGLTRPRSMARSSSCATRSMNSRSSGQSGSKLCPKR